MNATIQFIPRSLGRGFTVFSGWSLLLVYSVLVSSLGLDLAGFIGNLDGSHELRVRSGAEGLQLVLHHQQSCATHRHGRIAQAMTFFTVSSAADPDHLLQFAGSITHRNQANTETPKAPATAMLLTRLLDLHSDLRQLACATSSPQPPLIASARQLCLRSTLLLI